MSHRVKQLVIDTLADGTPYAVRVHAIRWIANPDDPERPIEQRDTFEVPYDELGRTVKTQVRNLLKNAAKLERVD